MKIKNNLLYVVVCLIDCICIGLLVCLGSISSRSYITFEDISGDIIIVEVVEEESVSMLKFWDGKETVTCSVDEIDRSLDEYPIEAKCSYPDGELKLMAKASPSLALRIAIFITTLACMISAIVLCFKIDFN